MSGNASIMVVSKVCLSRADFDGNEVAGMGQELRQNRVCGARDEFDFLVQILSWASIPSSDGSFHAPPSLATRAGRLLAIRCPSTLGGL